MSGTLTAVTVTLNNVSLPRTNNIDLAVVAPTGQAFMLMSDVGNSTATSAANITFSDAATSSLPITGGIPDGTYKPTNVLAPTAPVGSPDNDAFPSPGPASVTSPAPTGSATFASVFNGINPNGNWSL